MTRYGYLAAIPVLALAVPAFAQMQNADTPPQPGVAQPAPQYPAPQATLQNPNEPAPGPTAALTPPPPYPPVVQPTRLVPSVPTPGFVWIPGHYNWDPDQRNYIWLVGQYVQPPRPSAQWVGGSWQLTPAGWHWMDGYWN